MCTWCWRVRATRAPWWSGRTGPPARSADMRYFEERLADELAGLAGRSAAETTRMVQSLVASFSQDNLRDDMTILVAKVKSPASRA